MNTADKIERIQFLKRNIGDWSEADADEVCDYALQALGVGAPAPAKPNGPLHSPVDFTMSKECEADIKQIQRDMIAGSAAAAHIVVGAPAPAPTRKQIYSALSVEARKHGSHVTDYICSRMTDAILALPGLQAEAQAPTTQESVLTEDERQKLLHIYREIDAYSESLHMPGQKEIPQIFGSPYLPAKWQSYCITLKQHIDRLAGAPAPAPTMPTREQIAEAICDARLWNGAWLKANATESDAFIHEARAVLALIAKGDTP